MSMTQILSWLYSRSGRYRASNSIHKMSGKNVYKKNEKVSGKRLKCREEFVFPFFFFFKSNASDLVSLGRRRVAGVQVRGLIWVKWDTLRGSWAKR